MLFGAFIPWPRRELTGHTQLLEVDCFPMIFCLVGIFVCACVVVLTETLRVLCSVLVPVQEASREEWWSVRMLTDAATATAMRESSLPSPRAVTRGLAPCGTTVSGERWGYIWSSTAAFVIFFHILIVNIIAFPTHLLCFIPVVWYVLCLWCVSLLSLIIHTLALVRSRSERTAS